MSSARIRKRRLGGGGDARGSLICQKVWLRVIGRQSAEWRPIWKTHLTTHRNDMSLRTRLWASAEPGMPFVVLDGLPSHLIFAHPFSKTRRRVGWAHPDMDVSRMFPMHWAGWTVAQAPISAIIDAKTPQEREMIIQKWKRATVSTLTSVIYIVSRSHPPSPVSIPMVGVQDASQKQDIGKPTRGKPSVGWLLSRRQSRLMSYLSTDLVPRRWDILQLQPNVLTFRARSSPPSPWAPSAGHS
jgi:hypothetical protein